MTRNRIARLLALAVVAAFALMALALPASADTAASGSGRPDSQISAPAAIHAQITVDPSAPKRNFEEVEDRPWTLFMAKALMPAVIALLLFVIVWYIWKVARVRATTS